MIKALQRRIQARRMENRPALPPVVLSGGGLALFTAAGFTFNTAAGLIVAGLSLLLLEWRLDAS